MAITTEVIPDASIPVLDHGFVRLDAAMADGRHHDLLTAVLRKVVDGLEENRSVLRQRLETESPWWVPEPIDDRIFARHRPSTT